MYILNCIVLCDDPSSIFAVNVEQTQTVCDFREAIKEKKKQQFSRVDADSIKLWQVDLPVNDTIEHTLSSLTLDTKKFLSPLTKLQKIFSEIPDDEHLHIVVQCPPSASRLILSSVVPHIPLVDKRLVYLEKAIGAPSAGAKPASFAATQEKEEYLCNRPRRAADSLPVTLIEPIFAEFVDDCQNHQPTDCDNDFVWKLSKNMSSFITMSSRG
ncbi:hypothetical protein BDR07DRAFT_1492973 [Suillus spraguei]|nr:hypothetical protein BDR07DRAFT_1492973 [Suillus spraguei]